MPEISRFYGIVIKMHWRDHPPAHFQASYGGDEAIIDITRLSMLEGHLPARALRLVQEWGALHQAELHDLWESAHAQQPLHSLPPLP